MRIVLECASDSALTLAPTELAAQGVKEAALTEADQVDRVIGAMAADFVAEVKLESRLPIDGEQALRWDAFDANRESRIARAPRWDAA